MVAQPNFNTQPKPVRAAFLIFTGVITLVVGVFPVLQMFDVINWSADEMSQVVGFLALVTSTVAGTIASIWSENRVTPVSSPMDNEGNRLVPEGSEAATD